MFVNTQNICGLNRSKMINFLCLKLGFKFNIFKIFSLIFLAFFLFTFSVNAATTTPAPIIYEGRLLNSASVPITTAHTFRFSFWKSADFQAGDIDGLGAINPLSVNYGGWSESQTVTPNSNGTFSIELGKSLPLPIINFASVKYLQVEVKVSGSPDTSFELMDPTGDNGTDILDRQTIGSLSYAKNSDYLDNAELGTNAGDIATLDLGGIWNINTIPGGTNTDTFILDNDNTAGPAGFLTLQFGGVLAEYIKFDVANDWFFISNDLNLEQNQIKNFAIDNLAAAPGAPVTGQIYYNTGDNNTYIWNGVAWEDITTAAGGATLDSAYTSDPDKKLDVNNASGLILNSTVAGDIVFDLNSTGDLSIKDAGVIFARFTDTGTFEMDNLNFDGNTISALDLNGNINLTPNGTGKVIINSDNDIAGNIITLDSDNAIAGNDAYIIANQGTDADGALKYNATTNQWELSNDGGAYQKIITGPLTWSDIPNRVKNFSIFPEFPDTTIVGDGTNNKGTLVSGFTDLGGTGKINYYEFTTSKALMQDVDIITSFKLPLDFNSFTATPIKLLYKTNTNNTADNKIDVEIFDSLGNSVLLAGATNLASNAWTTANITFAGGSTFTAGTNITIKIKTSAISGKMADVSNITLEYNGK